MNRLHHTGIASDGTFGGERPISFGLPGKALAAELGIARWDGANWAMVGGDLGGSAVFALAVNDDGNGDALFAGASLHAWLEHFTSY